MTENEAYALVGALAAAGSGGWTDESIELYMSELEAWDDVAAAQAAVTYLVRSWTDTWRPSLGVITEYYRMERDRNTRQREETAQPAVTERIPTFAEGVEIARQAYHQQCYLRGRTPDEDFFLAWADPARRAARDDRRKYHDAR